MAAKARSLRRAGQDKDASYDPRCLYERLKAQYAIRPLYDR